jgi:hypothetical protein
VRNLLGAIALDHIGVAAQAADNGLAALLGGPPELTVMPSGVAVGRFGPATALELVVPSRPGTPIDRFLERRGPGLHHVALQVDEPLEMLLLRLEAAGVAVVGLIEPSSDGRPCLFLHPSATGGVLVEVVRGPRPG